MKVKDLLALLHDIPLEADIYLHNGGEVYLGDIKVEPITRSHHDLTVVGYLLVDNDDLKLMTKGIH